MCGHPTAACTARSRDTTANHCQMGGKQPLGAHAPPSITPPHMMDVICSDMACPGIELPSYDLSAPRLFLQEHDVQILDAQHRTLWNLSQEAVCPSMTMRNSYRYARVPSSSTSLVRPCRNTARVTASSPTSVHGQGSQSDWSGRCRPRGAQKYRAPRSGGVPDRVGPPPHKAAERSSR